MPDGQTLWRRGRVFKFETGCALNAVSFLLIHPLLTAQPSPTNGTLVAMRVRKASESQGALKP